MPDQRGLVNIARDLIKISAEIIETQPAELLPVAVSLLAEADRILMKVEEPGGSR